jgi:N-acetylglucosaminyldiphosphoundecaprenol N-acetyl-beta-D-mannosaminyltransferase
MPNSTPGENRVLVAGRLLVADAPPGGVTNALLRMWACRPGRPILSFAVHVGALQHLRDEDYLKAMDASDLNYADGAAITSLARAAGAKCIRRAATTDLGWQVIAEMRNELKRLPRVALIGAERDVAAGAASKLDTSGQCSVVFVEHGFHKDWPPVLSRCAAERPDIVFVGLGMPLEAKWSVAHRSHLPDDCLVMTCGGWFGFLAGEERRAPEWVQRVGGEWVWRLAQHPSRLWKRYALGLLLWLRHLAVEYARQLSTRRA